MKTLISMAILVGCAVLAAGCGTLDDGSLCQDHDGVLVCDPADDTLGSQEQAAINSGGFSGRLSYVCDSSSGQRICTCMGELDCFRMWVNECLSEDPDHEDDLDCPEGQSTMTCTCTSVNQRDDDGDGIGTSPYFPGEQQVVAP